MQHAARRASSTFERRLGRRARGRRDRRARDVAAVALIAGEYDLIVEVPYAWEQAARVIVGDLRSLEGIAATRTLVAVPELEPEDEPGPVLGLELSRDAG